MKRLHHMPLVLLLLLVILGTVGRTICDRVQEETQILGSDEVLEFQNGVMADGVSPSGSNPTGIERRIRAEHRRRHLSNPGGTRGWADHSPGEDPPSCSREHPGMSAKRQYRLLWEQMAQTRRHYEDLETKQYEAFMQQNRTKIAALLNRMVAGRTFGDHQDDRTTGPSSADCAQSAETVQVPRGPHRSRRTGAEAADHSMR